jgi:capsular exopolysaccharide synthesis family protein
VRLLALRKKKNTSRKLIASVDPKLPISEQYRTIRTNIQYSSIDKEIRTMMVTSSGPAEGKSTTTANLAIVFAQLGKKVLLVDGDLRKPTVHHTFSLNNLFGFTSVLTKQRTLEKAVIETEEKDLYILTSGPIPPNPASS